MRSCTTDEARPEESRCRCQQAVFVDKSEYEAQEIIACPLPGCTHAWCKACSRSIEFNGPRHSCDGSNELNHLMNQQGWKACPGSHVSPTGRDFLQCRLSFITGCRTPTSKIDGCNHMTVCSSNVDRFHRTYGIVTVHYTWV